MPNRPKRGDPHSPSRRRLRRLTLIAAGSTVILLAVAVQALLQKNPAPWGGADRTGTATMGGAFALLGRDGTAISSTDLVGQPFLLIFGFTSGHDDQLFRIQAMNHAREILAKTHPALAAQLRLVFATLDPETDTPARLDSWLEPLAFPVVGLTGPREAVAELATAYRVFVRRDNAPDAAAVERLTFTPLIYLVGPDGDHRTQFIGDIAPEALAAEIAKELRNEPSPR